MNPTIICNLALSKIGELRISKFGDTDSKEGREAALWFTVAVNEVINDVGAEFNSAIGRAGALAAVSDKPDFGWDYAYQVPSDCMRVLNIVDQYTSEPMAVDWVREGDCILTNETEVYIKYLKKDISVSSLSPDVHAAIYTLLASRLATAITADPDLSNSIYNEYLTVALPKAIASNNAEGYHEDNSGATTAEAGR